MKYVFFHPFKQQYVVFTHTFTLLCE